MMRLVLVSVLVAMVTADCGPMQKIQVKLQWSEAYGTGQAREAFAQALWRAIFRAAPEARSLFDRVHGDDIHSPEFMAHALRVAGGLDMAVSLIEDQAAFDAQMAHLQGQHHERNIPGNYFEVFGDALMQVVHASVGRCFDQDAWQSCYNALAAKIK